MMNKLLHSFSADNESFGPGTDLIVSLVAVLVLMLAINTNVYKKETIAMKLIRENQMQVIAEVAKKYNTDHTAIGKYKYEITTSSHGNNKIFIENDLTLQRITFGTNILFQTDADSLKSEGRETLRVVGDILKQKIYTIKEIQIQGHADPRASKKYKTNLDLASKRAIAVFNFLQKLGISPERHIMSATSFGEYKPVQRKYSDMNYSSRKLRLHNNTQKKKSLNRRIEIVLTYRQNG